MYVCVRACGRACLCVCVCKCPCIHVFLCGYMHLSMRVHAYAAHVSHALAATRALRPPCCGPPARYLTQSRRAESAGFSVVSAASPPG